MNTRKPNLQLEEQYKMQGECCYYCKEKIPFEYITRDHFYPVSKGNTLVNNKIFACRLCNSIKGNKEISDFYESIRNRVKKNILKLSIKNYEIDENDIKKLNRLRKISETIKKIKLNGNKPDLIFS